MNRDQRRQGSAVFTSRCREVAVAEGVGLLAVALLEVLVERTGRGTHAASCGRRHLGRALADAAGRERAYSVATVGRCLLKLTRAGLIRTKRRWSPSAPDETGRLRFTDPQPAWRYLSDKLLSAVGELATVRSRRRREAADAAPQPAPVESRVTGGCSNCGVVPPDHRPGCPNAPPAG